MSVITNTVPLAVFGPGSLYITRNDIAGQTPVNIGYCQEFSYDESAETKELYGTNQYPLTIARGTIKATGKAKAATVSGMALNAAFNGENFTTGQLQMAIGEPMAAAAGVSQTTTAPSTNAHLVVASTIGVMPGMTVRGDTSIAPGTFVISASGTAIMLNQSVIGTCPSATTLTFSGTNVVNAATFDTDLGVVYAASGLPLQYSVAPPTVGQYTVDPLTGTYAFAPNETYPLNVLVTYAYALAGTGQSITVYNKPIGTTPTFQLDYSTSLYGQPYYVRMYACVSNKLARAHKLTDFMMPEIDFGFFARGGDQAVYTVSYPQVS